MSVAVPMLAIVCGGLLPTPPYTSREAESGWGEPQAGLSILWATDSVTVPLGGDIRAEVFFRYSPFLAGGPGAALWNHPGAEEWALRLRDVRTGETWERRPYDAGMPIVGGPTPPPPLPYGPADRRSHLFILLSDDGEQVPAGTYDAVIRYRNEGDTSSRYGKRAGDDWPPLWRGTLESAPLRLRVLPRDADTTLGELPTRAVFSPDERHGGLAWSWDPDSWESVALVSRPGYHVATEMVYAYFAGDEPFPLPGPDATDDERHAYVRVWGMNASRSQGGLPNRDRDGGWGGRVGGERFQEVLDRGLSIRMVIRAKVFESSVAPGHMWMPERGDYRVLREWEITGEWP